MHSYDDDKSTHEERRRASRRQSFDLGRAPGHLVRRVHQLSTAVFMERTAKYGVTPVQFALLTMLAEAPGVDQAEVARRVAFDVATAGSAIGRLERKGWIARQTDTSDKRRKRLELTRAGRKLVREMVPAVHQARQDLLRPLSREERVNLIRLLTKLVEPRS